MEWKHDEPLRQRLESYLKDKRLTHAQMAGRLKLTSPTRLTKYLGLDHNRAEIDSERVERSVRQYFRHEDRLENLSKGLFETPVSRQVATVLRQIRRTGDIGLIHGPAGVGKSCGAALFRAQNPDVHMFSATFWRQGPRDIENLLFESIQADPTSVTRPYPGNVRRAVWLEELCRGTGGMIIIDTAQRMHITAFQWLFDFHDLTGVSIGLIGNPEVMDIVRPNDQLSSRIGIVQQVEMPGRTDQMEDIARRLVEQYAPASKEALIEEATNVLTRPGHARTLRKQLDLATTIKEGAPSLDWCEAFAAARTKLLKPAPPERPKRRSR